VIATQGILDDGQDAAAGVDRQAGPRGGHEAARVAWRVAWRVALGGRPLFSRTRSQHFESYIAHFPFSGSLGNHVFPRLFVFLDSSDESF